MVKPQERGPKKPYTTPKLTVHGTVQEITKTQGLTGHRDNGSFPKFLTHV
jgi:hypothetical protein